MASPSNPITPEKIDLGRKLYYDTRLSINHDLSCNSCHDLAQYGIDPRPPHSVSKGHKDQTGDRNSPTVYTAAGHFRQFWDGRAADVEEQAKGPVLNPIEMAMPDEDYVLKVLKSIPGYVDLFKKAFPNDAQPITYDNYAKAVGAFERKLVTPAPWDKFIAGDDSALTDAQKQGFNTFVKVGCMTCHMGPYIGGMMYQKTGLIKPWPSQKDLGRFAVTKDEKDKMMFKVPTLRNILKTGPYIHDGSISDIREVIKLMATHQLGKDLTDEQVDQIVAWFESLTGEIPTDYIAKPELPASGPDTPKPSGT